MSYVIYRLSYASMTQYEAVVSFFQLTLQLGCVFGRQPVDGVHDQLLLYIYCHRNVTMAIGLYYRNLN